MKDSTIPNMSTPDRLKKELGSNSSPASGKIDVNMEEGPGGGGGGVDDPLQIWR